MATINFTDITIPGTLELISSVIKNPKLDTGYLCTDMCPYFRFGSGWYTIVHPDRATEPVSVTVYQKTTRTVDGVEWDSMAQVGRGTQNGTTLTYNGTHSYANTYLDIRMHKTDKWSEVKPVENSGVPDELTDYKARDFSAGRIYGLHCHVMSGENARGIHNVKYRYYPPTTVKRLRDFDGYDHGASPELWGEWGAILQAGAAYATVSFAELSDGSVSFTEILRTLHDSTSGSVRIGNCYPCMLVSNNDQTKNFARALTDTATGQVTTLENMLENGEANLFAALTDIPYLFGGTGVYTVEARLSIFLALSLGDGLIGTDSWTSVNNAGATDYLRWLAVPNLTGRFALIGTAPVVGATEAHVESVSPGAYAEGQLPSEFSVSINCPGGFVTEDDNYGATFKWELIVSSFRGRAIEFAPTEGSHYATVKRSLAELGIRLGINNIGGNDAYIPEQTWSGYVRVTRTASGGGTTEEIFEERSFTVGPIYK